MFPPQLRRIHVAGLLLINDEKYLGFSLEDIIFRAIDYGRGLQTPTFSFPD